jgi:multiple sugar transport system substrate-binding protein
MKKVALISLLLALLLAVPAMAESLVPWEGEAASQGLSGKITFMHWGDDYERQMYADTIAAYMKKVPGVQVEQIYVPGMSDYFVKLQTLAASNTLPDVFWVNEARFAEYANAGMLKDLTDVVTKYPNLTSDMIEGLKDYGMKDGVTYAIPKDWTSYVMYLNTDRFKELGVDLPSKDWTTDDYIALAKKLTVKDGDRVAEYGTAISNYRIDWINYMGNFGAQWFKDGKSNVSSPEALKGLSVMSQVITDGSAPTPGSISATGDTEDRLFIIGKVAMFASGRWMVPSFRTECDFNWEAVEMPKGTTRCTPFCAGMLALNPSGTNTDIAANFISYLLSDEGLSIPMSSALAMPPYKHLLSNPDYLTTPPSTDAFLATAGYIGDPAQREILKTGKWTQFNDIMYAELSTAFEGSQTIEEAAKKIDEKANAEVFK